MTPELSYLAYVALLTAALWIPYVISQATTNGFLKPINYLDPTPRSVPLFGQRAHRAYLNAVETFAPFAALVIILHLTGKSSAMTVFWCTAFFWMRLAHAVVYLTAIAYVRTLVFTLGFFCQLGLFWEIIK